MYKKSRVGETSIKIEKENENIELRKRMKNLPKDKYWAYKKENVWDRLSKIQKSASIENQVGLTRSRSNVTNGCQRSKTVKQIVTSINPLEYPQRIRKPLSPNSASTNKRLDVPIKVRTQVSTAVPEIKAQTYAYSKNTIKSVEEIVTVRSLSRSKSSSDGKRDKKYQNQTKSPSLSQRSHLYIQCNKEALINKNDKDDESSDDSNEEYKLAPLMSSPSQHSNDSMKIVKNLNDFLCHKDVSLSSDDIGVVKDVIKSDKRYKSVDKNPTLFKEILETQLQKILKHESAVKTALEGLQLSPNTQQSQEVDIAKPLNEIVSYSSFNRDTQKLEVDVVFKNVPSLEKEIVILKALGEKLEATLKSASTYREERVASSRVFVAPITDTMLNDVSKYLPVAYEIKYEKHISYCRNMVEYSVRAIGIRYIFGIVKEFCMAEKTIFELKQEAKRAFYVPDCTDAVELRRTSFERLLNNPNEFLRYIKPRNGKVAFNLLEQDSKFFNSLFNKTVKLSNISIDLYDNDDLYKDKQMTAAKGLCEGGDSQIWKQTILQNWMDNEKNNQMLQINCENKNNRDSEIKNPQHLLEPTIRGKQRRRIRRCLTPMPINSYCNPKNSLFKTVLVGFVQMSVFIIFIMALTYPDFTC